MAPRKRGISEVDAPEPPREVGLLERIRTMWEFACVMQWIALFGKVVKIDEDFDIEDFENECLKPEPSDKLEDIGLCLLKWISSQRQLTLENWDDYTRRQYIAKAPQRNPYGDELEPKKFRDFDVFTKVRILHQLTVWTLWNPDRIREKMPEDKELDQTQWRVEEIGYDKDDRSYYVLDDNRLYRRTDPPLPSDPAWKPKSNTLKAQAARRKDRRRRRTTVSETPEVKDEDDDSKLEADDEPEDKVAGSGDTFGGYKWECVAITLAQYKEFLAKLQKTRDANERLLRQVLEEDVVPIIEKAEEAQLRKIQRRERELLNMEKLAGAKRSSRLAGKHERERIEREQADAIRKREVDLKEARKMEEEQHKREEERQSRMLTREQRIKEREYQKILHEEELAQMEEEAKKVEAGESKVSERRLKAEMEKRKKDLEELENEDDWMFDCSGCGRHGKNLDDGSHSMACENCSVWQHSKCHDISQAQAERDDFHFVCKDCLRKEEEEAKKPKIPPLKFRIGASSSPPLDSASITVAKKRQTSTSPTAQKLSHIPIISPSANQVPQPTTNGSSAIHHPPVKHSPPHQNSHFGPSSHMYHKPPPNSQQLQIQSSPNLEANGVGGRLTSQGYYYNQMSPPTQLSPSAQFFSRNPGNHHQVPGDFRGQTQFQARPSSSHSNHNLNATPAKARTLPSPIQNRPSMSPTQGNPEVGPIAGIPTPRPNPSSSMSPPDLFSTPQPASVQAANGISRPPSHPELLSQSPSAGFTVSTPHMSGRSPIKHSPTLNLDPQLPQHQYYHPGSTHLPTARSVSGTPIYPPSSTLAPSPKQLDKTPMPTPSKTMTPLKQGDAELARVAEGTERMIKEQLQGNGYGHGNGKGNQNRGLNGSSFDSG